MEGRGDGKEITGFIEMTMGKKTEGSRLGQILPQQNLTHPLPPSPGCQSGILTLQYETLPAPTFPTSGHFCAWNLVQWPHESLNILKQAFERHPENWG